MSKATEWDHRIIDGISYALKGQIGQDDDVERLLAQVREGPAQDKERTLAEIAIAFIRWSQDLKDEKHKVLNQLRKAERQ